MPPTATKKSLLACCQEWIDQRKSTILQNITHIEAALFEESKGTSGDKHHTGRAMLQIDRENAGKQLREIEKVYDVLSKINVEMPSVNARLGSLVDTSHGTYFIAISAGMVQLKNQTYYCVSVGSPIAQLLLGKKEGESIESNSKKVQIFSVN